MVIAEVRIELKKGVADPEGANTRKALELLGFKGVSGVCSIKTYVLTLDEKDPKKARAIVDEMCRKLLSNPVIHNYKIDLV
ncbi:MAG: phosphoribosylformylglycinamidine synthase subunit PurS [Methanobacteriota archaeon]